MMPAYDPQPQALIEATRDAHVAHCAEGCPVIDMLNELLHLRTQAARLAAVEQAVADNQWIREGHGVTRANDLRPRGYCTYDGEKHPCSAIGLLEDIEAALKGAADGC